MMYEEQDKLGNIGPLKNNFCFVIIENGNGIVKLNKVKTIFSAPVVFCLNEKDTLSIDENLKIKAKIIYFHPSIINTVFNFENIRNIPKDFSVSTVQDRYLLIPFLETEDEIHGKFNLDPISTKKFTLFYNKLKNETNIQGINWACRSRSYLMEIFFFLDNLQAKFMLQDDAIINETSDEISLILLYLINNYDKKITITELTKKFSMNRTTLSDNFNKAVGESIITYLNKLRINMAAVILRDTRLPISEIIVRVGFSENTHFFRTFKKYKGMSPSEYREKYCFM